MGTQPIAQAFFGFENKPMGIAYKTRTP